MIFLDGISESHSRHTSPSLLVPGLSEIISAKQRIATVLEEVEQ
jgi:hypothetical protein